MAEKDTCGPAFHTDDEKQTGPNTWHFQGMTLRDYFAGQVLIGLSIGRNGKSDAHDAELSYSLADAMLKARGE